jgi:hypothetical protein
MADPASSLDTPQGTPSKSFLSRLIGVVIEPGETFDDIARKPDWIPPMVVLWLVAIVVVETMLLKIGAYQIALQSLQRSGRTTGMGEDQLIQMAEKIVPIVRIQMHVIAVLGAPIFFLAVAGIGLLILNVFFGQHAKFKNVLGVTCYANLPSILSAVMTVAVVFFGDANAFNPQSPSPTNPGYFMNPQTASHAIYAVAGSLDIFTFWFMILLAMGLSRLVEKKVKTGTVFMTLFGGWLLLVMVKVGLALIF